MNKRALLGKLLIFAIIIIIIMGTTIYFTFSKNSIATTIGKVTVDVSYNNTESQEEIIIEEIPKENETLTVSNITSTNLSSNYTNPSDE